MSLLRTLQKKIAQASTRSTRWPKEPGHIQASPRKKREHRQVRQILGSLGQQDKTKKAMQSILNGDCENNI